MPLTSTEYWLDWDSAVSIVGTDIAVKQTYEALIDSSSERPELFVDIGANYGTHSLLFLAQGIESITFEPNSSCHDYFIKLCKLNMVTPRLEQVALGDREGYVELSYPPRDTWLGSTDAETKHKLSLSQELITETVEQRMLDDYVAEIKRNRTLIKIDTEGNELAVLRGAMHILQEYGPKIIFESWGGNDRTDLFDLFTVYGYSIYQLPWSPRHTTNPLALQHFTECQSTNFIAIPESHSNSS